MAKKIIKARLKQRTDTQANWAANNPVLLEGELGLVTDDKNLYKVGDGVTAWNDLPFRGFDGTLVHETGGSDSAAMSQRGVTQALAELKERMVEKVPGKGLSTEDYTTEEKEKLAGLQNFNDTEIKNKLKEKEDKTNKVSDLSDESTDVQYPSAKAVYDLFIRLKERIEEQDVFIEDLEYHKLTANSDNRYPDISVGTADNLAGVDVVDSEINFRRSGGGAITDGVARIEVIKGNSVVWNQQVKLPGSGATDSNSVIFEADMENMSFLVNGTATGGNGVYGISFSAVKDHIYALTGCPQNGGVDTYMFYNQSSAYDTGQGVIYKEARNTGTAYNVIRINEGTSVTNLVFKPRIYNLTQMFGAGNEPTTIAEFYQRIPMGVDMNAYNEGEVIHMDVQSIESVGVNQWDEDKEVGDISATTGLNVEGTSRWRTKGYIEVLPNAKYYIYAGGLSAAVRARFYTDDYSVIGTNDAEGAEVRAGREIKIPANTRYIRFSPNISDLPIDTPICINLSDTAINGQYFPYIKRVEDLSVIRKYFPQGMKSAGAAHDELRYNKQTNRWEEAKYIGEVDLGICNWMKSSSGIFLFEVPISPIKGAKYSSNILTSQYVTVTPTTPADLPDKSLMLYNGAAYPLLGIRDSAYTDAASFKAAMAGVMLYYELAEPIVTELDEADQFKDLDYQVWNAGTEKAIAEGKSSAFAADLTYGFNAVGKIKELEGLVAQLRAKVGI